MLTKLAPESGSGKVKNVTSALRLAGSGAGFNVIAKTADALIFRGFFNNVGFNVPIVGIRMSLIDVGNYLAHNGGNFVPKNTRPFIAVGAAKATEGTLSLGGLNLNALAGGTPAGEGPNTTPGGQGIGF